MLKINKLLHPNIPEIHLCGALEVDYLKWYLRNGLLFSMQNFFVQHFQKRHSDDIPLFEKLKLIFVLVFLNQ